VLLATTVVRKAIFLVNAKVKTKNLHRGSKEETASPAVSPAISPVTAPAAKSAAMRAPKRSEVAAILAASLTIMPATAPRDRRTKESRRRVTTATAKATSRVTVTWTPPGATDTSNQRKSHATSAVRTVTLLATAGRSRKGSRTVTRAEAQASPAVRASNAEKKVILPESAPRKLEASPLTRRRATNAAKRVTLLQYALILKSEALNNDEEEKGRRDERA